MNPTTTPDAPPIDEADDGGFIWSSWREADLSLAADDAKRRADLWTGLVNAVLTMAGIVGAGWLLYFREDVWAWATGDPVSFAAGLIGIALGSVLSIRAVRERQ